MKKLLLYLILIIACIGIYVGLYYFYIPNVAETTFEYKRDSLEMSIKGQIKKAWDNNNALLYFKDYGGAKYLRMDLNAVRMVNNIKEDKNQTNSSTIYTPSMLPYLAWDLFPNGRYADNVRKAFRSLSPGSFDDLYEMYYIRNKPWIGTFITPYENLYNIKVFTYTPIFVGYKKETLSLREYRPSFDKSCQEAKEYIQKEDTDTRMYYSSQNEKKVQEIFNLHNEYYYFQYRNINRTFNPENAYFEDFDFAEFNFNNHSRFTYSYGEVSWVYNNFYKVYYYSQRTGTMFLAFNDTKYSQDIDSYLSSKRTICNIFFFICLGILVFLILLTVYNYKKTNKEFFSTKNSICSNSMSDNNTAFGDTTIIYEKVIKLSNPEIYIKPYQPEKLEKANRIYSAALKNKDNITILEKLLEEAVQL